jgi:hypothetical protein
MPTSFCSYSLMLHAHLRNRKQQFTVLAMLNWGYNPQSATLETSIPTITTPRRFYKENIYRCMTT